MNANLAAPITGTILEYTSKLKKASTDELKRALTDLQIREQGIKNQLKQIRQELNRRQKETAPCEAATSTER